ncbi:hypothetical protein [Hymenobacter rubidus]|uniref:hypothetical protein n=1 Tax=Hymenobacter rubidus TaxID=1441626 RepID=UPI00191F152F|nr:hypothetical protein [Hymenobacter rubidus]
MPYKVLILAALLIFSKSCFAQSNGKEYEVNFAWEVKQLDEFIERFNNDKSSFINKYVKNHESTDPLTRNRIIKSLFDAKGQSWNYQQINEFLKEVDNAEHPQYLDFNGDKWFARATCDILYHGKPSTATIILMIDNLSDGSSKWIIADIRFSNQVRTSIASESSAGLVECPIPADSTSSLSPMSHAIGFMNIDLATKNPKNIRNFVIGSKSTERSKNLNLFIDACLKNNLKILQVHDVTYSFLQITGWRIEIKQFTRQSMNSGWLITKLVKLT